MRYLDEFRNKDAVKGIVEAITSSASRRWRIMEVCGGQTHSIVRYGIDQLLFNCVELIHGPGCPVCVTSMALVDKAVQLALRPDVIFCSFGDMLRVPGTSDNLLSVKARGGDVRMLYSPTDAVKIAAENPAKQIVFFAVGFETTAPAAALALLSAEARSIENFSLLVSHVLVPPAVEAILGSPECDIDGFLAPGHVCTVTGYHDYERLAAKYGVPFVVTGFEPLDILLGLKECIDCLENNTPKAINSYARVVTADGNAQAQAAVNKVFTIVDREWRGLGSIPLSGLGLRDEYACYDAEKRFPETKRSSETATPCISGLILRGAKKPCECSAFGTLCTPEIPLGATMVSSEGACAAYYRYRR